MQCQLDVKLPHRAGIVPAILTTDTSGPTAGRPVVVVEGEHFARGPEEVEVVYARAGTPVELTDAAVGSGFYVVLQPARGRG